MITSVEVLNIPSPFDGLSAESRNIIVKCFDLLYSESSKAVLNTIEIKNLEDIVENEFEKAFSLSERDIVYVNDTLDYNFGIFQKGINAVGYHRVLQEELRLYANTLQKSFSRLLKGTGLYTNVTVYAGKINEPLQLIVLDFGSDKGGVEEGSAAEFKDALCKIDKYLWERQAESIYMSKTLKYYDGTHAYVIKPNQKRFWSCMQAYDDAASIVNDFLNQ